MSGRPGGVGETGTAMAQAARATATQAAIDGPAPTAADIAGFRGLPIDATAVNIPLFRKLDVLLGGARGRPRRARGSAGYRPLVLGHGYAVGDARGPAVPAHLLIRHRATFEQAVAGARPIGRGEREERLTTSP